MQDLRSALDRGNGKAPGPNHVEARFVNALPAPVQWLLVHSYRAIVRGAPPLMRWRDAHIWLSPKVPGSAKLDDYQPIALGQLDMKVLTGHLTQRITQVLTRHGVVSEWQRGALPGSNTGPPLFMAQRQVQRGGPKYVFSFDTAPHGALHLILRHLSVPSEVIELLLFLQTAALLRIATAHGLTQPVHMLRGVRQAIGTSPIGKCPTEKSPIRKCPIGRSPVGKSCIGISPIGKSPIGKSFIGKSTIGTSPLGNPLLGNSPLGNLPLGNAPSGNPTLGNAPLQHPPFENAPLGNAPPGNRRTLSCKCPSLRG